MLSEVLGQIIESTATIIGKAIAENAKEIAKMIIKNK
ncbi:gp003 (endogenous virus) [Lactococcus phage KSY1]|uniref:Gp003 n=1 Tax=Lactococcus phage KSY1 TaxID=2913972 RepID=A6MA68_9CAUD|nr:gp003 [Lactococcus phage KSY1]ABG21546.1 gp003 [Lactococcus phage KSY1]